MVEKSILLKKDIALWAQNWNRFSHILKGSVRSRIFGIKGQRKPGAVTSYFQSVYSKPENLRVMDGNETEFLEQIFSVATPTQLSSLPLVDIGCGRGQIYSYLIKQGKSPPSYIGFDAGHPSQAIPPNGQIINREIGTQSIENELPKEPFKVCAINSLCYMNDLKILQNILDNKFCSDIILLEPTPGIFWDVYWKGIKPTYRKPHRLKRELRTWGYQATSLCQFYYKKTLFGWFWELCYAIKFLRFK